MFDFVGVSAPSQDQKVLSSQMKDAWRESGGFFKLFLLLSWLLVAQLLRFLLWQQQLSIAVPVLK